jgi:hypothetical protein
MSYYDEITKAIYAIYEYISKNTGTLLTGTAAVTQATLPVVETVVVEAVPSPMIGVVILAGIMLFNLVFGGNQPETTEEVEEPKK